MHQHRVSNLHKEQANVDLLNEHDNVDRLWIYLSNFTTETQNVDLLSEANERGTNADSLCGWVARTSCRKHTFGNASLLGGHHS